MVKGRYSYITLYLKKMQLSVTMLLTHKDYRNVFEEFIYKNIYPKIRELKQLSSRHRNVGDVV